MRRRILAGLAGLALAAGIGLSASPAMAQTPGPSASQNATINLAVSLQMTSTLPATFTLTSANASQGTAAGGGQETTTTNDPLGFFIDIQGPASFGAVPTSDVTYGTLESAWAVLPTTATMDYSQTAPTPANGDTETSAGYYLNTIPNLAGSFTGTIVYTSWAN